MTAPQMRQSSPWLVGIILMSLLGSFSGVLGQGSGVAACDREMRKTLEAIEAWRSSHNGAYPARLADLKQAGLLPSLGGICPSVIAEGRKSDPSHAMASSRGAGRDPAGSYEYELSTVPKSERDRPYLPDQAPAYTRQDLKLELLRRAHGDQVPILRCSSHRDEAPPDLKAQNQGAFRNLTSNGTVYWSRDYWELNWVSDVPFCCRDANVLFGLKGPPFFTETKPTLANALDLRAWNCAFGDHPWWWTFPMLDRLSKTNSAAARRTAPDFRSFFKGRHGLALTVAKEDWWIDGLVQLQGRILPSETMVYQGLTRQSFVWSRTNLPVHRTFQRAAWLQATLWPVAQGETVGWLVWHYADGTEERTPLVYGETTARFWAETTQTFQEKDYPRPAWQIQEPAAAVGKERWIRIYEQSWANPRPSVVVQSLDFVSNPDSVAAPLLIAVNVSP